MKIHEAHAEWRGGLQRGVGKLDVGSGAFEGKYDFGSRFGDGDATTPEELLGAAHAGCFSMALCKLLSESGFEPKVVDTRAEVRLSSPEDGEPSIEAIDLFTTAEVPEIESGRFGEIAEMARTECIVSRVLKGANIRLDATLTE